MKKRAMKPAYLWIVDWNAIHPDGPCKISADLFFSSKDRFIELLGPHGKKEQLVKVKVPIAFDNWDYIPDNY